MTNRALSLRLNWNEIIGYTLIVAASCFFGGAASLGKDLMRSGISTVMLMQTRATVTALLLIVILALTSASHLKISRKDLPGLIALAIPGLALVNVSYYQAIKLLPVALAVFIQFTAPVLIFVYGLLTRKEQLTKPRLLALLLSIAGTYLMVQLHGGYGKEFSVFGLVCAIVSMLSYAFHVVLSHALGKKHSPWTLIVYGYGIAALFWCTVQNPVETATHLLKHQLWNRALLFSIVSTLIPFSLFLTGLRRVTATAAAITSTSETVTASFFAYLWLGETLTPLQIIGAALILSAVLILIYQSKEVAVAASFVDSA